MDGAIANDQEILKTGTPSLNVEETVTRPDGSTSRIITSKVPLRDIDGSVSGILGIFADITQQKHAEEALRESERRLATLMNNLPGMAYRRLNDAPWTMEFVSEGAVLLTGYRPEKIINNAQISYADIIHPEDREDVLREITEALRDREPFELNYRIVTASGSLKTVWEQGEGVFGDDGEIIGIEGFISDVTGQKQAEEALRESEARFRAAVQSYLMPFAENGEDVFEGRTVALQAVRKDGTGFPIDLSVAPLKRNGKAQVIAVVRDVTERVAAEQQLQQAQRMQSLGNLAGGVAHELNNLLLPIQTLTQMTLKQLPDESRERTKLEKVIEASQRAKDLVAQVMDFSRQAEGEREDIEIREVVEKAAQLLKTALPSTLKIKRKLKKDVGIVRADPSQIGTILMNLGSNAADACGGKPGEINISLSRVDISPSDVVKLPELNSGPHAKLSIKDSGNGMDAETLERVFDPFFTTKEVGEGTGLGLSMVHGIVARHYGAIRISSAPGDGTRVDVYFPLSSARELN